MISKIYGFWADNNIEYCFDTDGTFKIFWKTKNVTSNGKYCLINSVLYLQYGINLSLCWNGTIEILTDTLLQIRDNSNEIGKIDVFKRKPENIIDEYIKTKSHSFFYPIIKYPSNIVCAIENPLLVPTSIAKPKIEVPLKRTFSLDDLYKFTLLPVIAFSLIYASFKSDQIVFIIPGFLFLSIIIYQIKQFLYADEIYEMKIKDFDSIMAPYDARQKEISEFEKNSSNIVWLFNKKKEKILSIFQNSAVPEYFENDAKVGKNELYFFSILKNKFGDKILRNSAIRVSTKGKTYIPDIIYADTENNIYIDIEIDEPYSYAEKEPIHYLEELYISEFNRAYSASTNISHTDEKRDSFFLENNWIVIRFSEFQIVKNSSECIKTIELVVEGITEHCIVRKETLIKNDIKTHLCWNYFEAKKMALDNIRNRFELI